MFQDTVFVFAFPGLLFDYLNLGNIAAVIKVNLEDVSMFAG